MNGRYDNRSELDDFHDEAHPEREISLGTATILGIFFALALLCAVFFGFGYSLGRKSAQPTAPTAIQTPLDAQPESAKPAPGSSPIRPSPAQKQNAGPSPAPDTPTEDQVVVRETDPGTARTSRTAPAVTQVPQPATPPAAAAAPLTVAIGAPGSALVQVAAVSHQEDADVLVTSLKRKGYNVTIRQVPQDKLLHVQIGPFATKKDAEAMRQRLLADGYNAIVK